MKEKGEIKFLYKILLFLTKLSRVGNSQTDVRPQKTRVSRNMTRFLQIR